MKTLDDVIKYSLPAAFCLKCNFVRVDFKDYEMEDYYYNNVYCICGGKYIKIRLLKSNE